MSDRWRAAVEKELKGAPFDSLVSILPGGIRIEPLYRDRPGPPALSRNSPPVAGAGDAPDRSTNRLVGTRPGFLAASLVADTAGTAEMRQWIADEIRGGAEALVVEPDVCADPRFPHVLAPLEVGGVALVTAVGASLPAAEALTTWANARSVKLESIGLDPLGAFARDGSPEPPQVNWRAVASLAEATAGRPLLVSTEPYHDAGADSVRELAYALATSAELLRRLQLPPSLVASRLAWRFAIGREVLVEIAKLRAARWLFRKLFAASGVAALTDPLSIAVTSARTQSRRDPWVNVLRGTTQAFAAIIGGASVVAVRPYDAALGVSDELARRLARNTLLVLRHESRLDELVDPARGAYAIEHITDQLARRAWDLFRTIEREGGMAARLRSGVVKTELAAQWEERLAALRSKREAITGITEFADPRERPLARSPRATLAATDASRACPLPRHRDAESFERTVSTEDGTLAWAES